MCRGRGGEPSPRACQRSGEGRGQRPGAGLPSALPPVPGERPWRGEVVTPQPRAEPGAAAAGPLPRTGRAAGGARGKGGHPGGGSRSGCGSLSALPKRAVDAAAAPNPPRASPGAERSGSRAAVRGEGFSAAGMELLGLSRVARVGTGGSPVRSDPPVGCLGLSSKTVTKPGVIPRRVLS